MTGTMFQLIFFPLLISEEAKFRMDEPLWEVAW